MRLHPSRLWKDPPLPADPTAGREASKDDFKRYGSAMLSKSQYPYDISNEDMVYWFGGTPHVLTLLWMDLLRAGLPQQSKPIHILWWLYHTKHYPKKKIFANVTKCAYKTTKKYMDVIKKKIMILVPSIVLWNNRFRHDKHRSCKTYTDGIDCIIKNPPKSGTGPYPFDTKWFGHKSGKATLRYLVTSCIQTGEVVAVHGPFPAGTWPDQRIYKNYLVPMLAPGEMVEADRGFWGAMTRRPDNWFCRSEKKAKGAVAGRHETINGRFKNYNSLSVRSRHDRHEHKYYFYTAIIMYNLMHRQHGPTFDVYY